MALSDADLRGFAAAVQSLKLYRRAELRSPTDEPLIEGLYVDPLQNDAVLETMLRPNTTFVIGRKGTGKSTIFQRAQHEIRKRRDTLSAYVDIKTVFESALVETGLGQKLTSLDNALGSADVERVLLYRAFIKAVFQDIQRELRSQIDTSWFAKILGAKSPTRQDLIEDIDDLIEGAFEGEIADVTAIVKSAVSSSAEQADSRKSNESLNAGLKVDLTASPSLNVGGSFGQERQSSLSERRADEYSQILIRTFSITSVMERLDALLQSVGVRSLHIYLDDFSELPHDAMEVFVDTVLAPLNNWSNELIKFKVAAYPGRIYLGNIDPTKIDEVYLDIFRLYGTADVASMEEKATDFTKRLLESRFSHFLGKSFSEFCQGDFDEVCRQLFFATMGNPRLLGHILHNLRESQVAYGKLIGVRAIQDAAARYYEEKIEPYFGIQKFAHETFEERSSLFSLKELLETLVRKARDLRDYKESAVTRELSGATPSSHFHVLSELESLLSTLELNFFLTKYYEMKDRDGRKVSVFALNYGLCMRHSISFGRPTGRREHRLYFVERIFDYAPILRKYLQNNQEIRCDHCGAIHGLDKLESLALFDMLCPTCRKGTCKVTNLSRKYETVLNSMSQDLLLPPTELGILETLYTEDAKMQAAEIAGELDCSYQLVGKRGKIMEERGLVVRTKSDKNRRLFSLTEQARDEYFENNPERQLDLDIE